MSLSSSSTTAISSSLPSYCLETAEVQKETLNTKPTKSSMIAKNQPQPSSSSRSDPETVTPSLQPQISTDTTSEDRVQVAVDNVDSNIEDNSNNNNNNNIPQNEATTTENNNDSIAQQEQQKEQQHQVEAMKLVVRSPYWGRILKGKTRRDYDDATTGIPGRPYRFICCQAVLSAVEGQYWGCCPHHGKRVLELREYHFTDVYPGNWDLYMIGSSVAPSYTVHAFFMLPQNQTVIDLACKIATQGWAYMGTANAQCVRLDLEGMLANVLKQNHGVGFHYHHVHLEILMDQVFDRETPRSRKAAIEKSRTDRSSVGNNCNNCNSSIVTPYPADHSSHSGEGRGSPSGQHEQRAAATTPPIPQIVSNHGGGADGAASWFSSAAEVSPSTFATEDTMVRGGWNAQQQQQQQYSYQHHYPSTYPHPAWNAHEQQYPQQYHPQQHQQPQPQGGGQWYPASMNTTTAGQYPPPHLHIYPHAAAAAATAPAMQPQQHCVNATMNPAQQLLHQGYVAGTDSILPPLGYATTASGTAGAMDPYNTAATFGSYAPTAARYQQVPQRYFPTGTAADSSLSSYYPAAAAAAAFSYAGPLPHLIMPAEQEDRNDGEEALNRENNAYHQQTSVDEKFSEDVATASVSETTAEDEDDEEGHNHHHPPLCPPAVASGATATAATPASTH